MARTAKGQQALVRARRSITQAKTVEQLRQAQAVVLPLDHDLSLEATAQCIGVSVGWASHLRNAYIRGEVLDDDTTATRGGRHHAHFTPEQEAEVVEPLLDRARANGVLVVPKIKQALEAALGRPVAVSTVYNLLHRHGWHKRPPGQRSPQCDAQTQPAPKPSCPRKSARPAKPRRRARTPH